MKKKTKFIMSNDLTITPMNSSSTIGLLRKMQVDINDLEEFQITISKAEVCFQYLPSSTFCSHASPKQMYIHLSSVIIIFLMPAAHKHSQSFIGLLICIDRWSLKFARQETKDRDLNSTQETLWFMMFLWLLGFSFVLVALQFSMYFIL